MGDRQRIFEPFGVVRSSESEVSWVHEWWDAEKPSIISSVTGLTDGHDSKYQMDVLGARLVDSLQVLSRFAEILVNGHFISEHIDRNLEDLVEEDDGSLLDYIDSKNEALRYLHLLVMRLGSRVY